MQAQHVTTSDSFIYKHIKALHSFAFASWSEMAVVGPLNLIEISYQWKKWNTINEISRNTPSGQKPEVLMSYFLSLIYVVECFGENWAKPLQPKKFTSGEISGISLINRLNHSRPNFWSAGDPGIHILSYIIIYYHILSYIIIYYHILSYMIIYDHIWSYMIIYDHIWSYIIIYYHILSYIIICYHILSYNIIFIYVYSDDIRIHNTISINFSLLSLEGVILIVYV